MVLEVLVPFVMCCGEPKFVLFAAVVPEYECWCPMDPLTEGFEELLLWLEV